MTGPITLSISGQTTATVSSLVVGSYGSFGNSATTSTAPIIIAGKAGTTVGEMELKETIPGSLVWGRTITLTLPTNVAWAEAPDPGLQQLHQHRQHRVSLQFMDN